MALIATGLVAVTSGHATFAAFSLTAQNTNDSYAAGTVTLADNDAGTVMWDVANQLPTSPARGPVHPRDLHGVARPHASACTRRPRRPRSTRT